MFIDVNQFSHLSCDSDMIQAALDLAQKTGESVLVPKYNKRTGKAVWSISKTIYLHNESTLLLQNCYLRQEDGTFCHIFASENLKYPNECAKENEQYGITIRGVGYVVLDGGVHNGVYENNGIIRKVVKDTGHHATENIMMRFCNVKNLVIDNLHIRNQRYWALPLKMVTYSRISNLDFSSESNVPNQDGLGIGFGCHDVIAENITGCVGDNLVAICGLTMTDDRVATDVCGDVYNITVRNVMGYGVGGCALIRILNHDGIKIYNIRIDNVIETSPWSRTDAPLAQNPDLAIKTDDEGNIIPWKRLVPGEIGYRTEAAIIIGESYWYAKSKAEHGDTYGISISNVMTHSRFAIWLNNTVLDSTFDNIRLFGNGYMAVFFGEGKMENLRFSNISYDKNCAPHPEDKHIRIDWNQTKSDGLSCVYSNGAKLTNISFTNMECCDKMESVFGGEGEGQITCENIRFSESVKFSNAKGIEVLTK